MDRSARAGASADTRALPVLRIGSVRVFEADVLETLSLTSWVKTTGGRGLHVVVPIQPSLSWSDCLAFSRDVSEVVARTDPGLYTTAFSKRGRERKILLDYLRNNRTNTSICALEPPYRAAPTAASADGSVGSLLDRITTSVKGRDTHHATAARSRHPLITFGA
jgi:hypothetical protein